MKSESPRSRCSHYHIDNVTWLISRDPTTSTWQ